MAKREELELESGLADDFDAFVTQAEFGYRSDYKNQAGEQVPLLIMYTESDTEGELEITWSLGDKWTPDRKGESVTHENDSDAKQRGFQRQSNMGKLLNAVFVIIGKGDVKKGADKFWADFCQDGKYSVRDAALWQGHGFHWKRPGAEELTGFDLERVKEGKASHLLPVAYLGKQGSNSKTPSKALGGKPAKAETPDDMPNGHDPALVKKLTALAKAMKDNDTFQTKAFNIDGVVDDDELMGKIMDGSFYEEATA